MTAVYWHGKIYDATTYNYWAYIIRQLLTFMRLLQKADYEREEGWTATLHPLEEVLDDGAAGEHTDPVTHVLTRLCTKRNFFCWTPCRSLLAFFWQLSFELSFLVPSTINENGIENHKRTRERSVNQLTGSCLCNNITGRWEPFFSPWLCGKLHRERYIPNIGTVYCFPSFVLFFFF